MITIMDEMVEVAAKSESDWLRIRFPEQARYPEDFDDDELCLARGQMRAALSAVAPFIAAAEREECEQAVLKEAIDEHEVMTATHRAYNQAIDDAITAIRARNTL